MVKTSVLMKCSGCFEVKEQGLMINDHCSQCWGSYNEIKQARKMAAKEKGKK